MENMKQKTQLQYLIDELIERAKTEEMISINLVLGLAVIRLEKEKRQIIDLCTEAYESGLGHKEYSAQ